MTKSIQIPLDLFIDLYDFVTDTDKNNFKKNDLIKRCNEKLDKIVKHELFTRYKKANFSSEEREYYRKKYLEEVGMKQSFTTNKEVVP